MRRPGLLAVALILAACQRGADAPLPGAGDDLIDLTGAGATFPYPVYARWISRFATETGVRINYQSIGSGGGLRALEEGTVDFGTSDVPLDSAAFAGRSAGTLVQIPLVVGGVVVTYNLPGIATPLRFDGALLADIFLGRVTRWDDRRIASLNPGVPLPALPIRVVHRADPSGTTRIFSRFLAASNEHWRAGPGTGPEAGFPGGTAMPGNEGVAAEVKASPGTIGYVEQSYATLNRLPGAAVRNSAGLFVEARPASLAAAARSGASPARHDGLPSSLLGATDATAYPIAEFSWMVMPLDPSAPGKVEALTAFVRWSLASGADDATALGYAPLPDAVRRRVEVILDSLARGARRP